MNCAFDYAFIKFSRILVVSGVAHMLNFIFRVLAISDVYVSFRGPENASFVS